MTFDTPTLFYFVLSGFVTVWTFRYVTKSKKHGEFEYAGLSVFWGLALLAFFEFVIKDQQKIAYDLKNYYAYGAAASVLGFFFGLIGGGIARNKEKIIKAIFKPRRRR